MSHLLLQEKLETFGFKLCTHGHGFSNQIHPFKITFIISRLQQQKHLPNHTNTSFMTCKLKIDDKSSITSSLCIYKHMHASS